MEDLRIEQNLLDIVGTEHIKVNEPMKNHTTFRIGGNADWFVTPDSVTALQKVLMFCKENDVPYYIIGNGSNLLVGDNGYRGVIIQIYKEWNRISVEGNIVKAQAGALLSKIANTALGASLTGFEFAAGIPGTAGGAVVMNAGAYDGEMKQIIESATVLDENGEIITLSNQELELGYRTSIIQKKPYIVLEIVYKLEPGEKVAIKAKMDELKEKRVSKQPLEFPSAGSTFKRPEGMFAGKLIMDAGFCGFQVGGARVSDKHCGFVINTGDATAADVMELIRQIQDKIYVDEGVMLELEVRRIGEFTS